MSWIAVIDPFPCVFFMNTLQFDMLSLVVLDIFSGNKDINPFSTFSERDYTARDIRLVEDITSLSCTAYIDEN